MTPEQFKQYLASLDPESRLQVAEGMWQHIDAQRPGWEQLDELMSQVNIHDFEDVPAAGGSLGDLLDFAFSLGPNALASGVGEVSGEGAEFDPHRSYATYLVEQGVPWWLAGVLGSVMDVVEPGPGELKGAVKAGMAGLPALGPLLRRLPELLGGETLFRLQDAASGLGPFQGIPSKVVARGNRTGQPAQYWTPNTLYLDSSVRDLPLHDLSGMEVLTAAPRMGSTTLDITDPGAMDMDLFRRLAGQVGSVEGLTEQQMDYLLRAYNEVLAGAEPPYHAIRSTQLATGFDMGGAPHAAGIDRLVQFPDDNIHAGQLELQGRLLNYDPLETEHVVFNPSSLYVDRSMTPDEFMDRLSGGRLPHLPRGVEFIRTADQANLLKTARGGQGFTFDPRTGQAYSGPGYVFSPNRQTEFSVPLDELSQADLDEFLNRNADWLADPSNYLGGWFNADDGKFYLDVSRVIQDKDEALRQALAAQQLAIWDLANNAEVPTGFRR